jgi:hypothetical protein
MMRDLTDALVEIWGRLTAAAPTALANFSPAQERSHQRIAA